MDQFIAGVLIGAVALALVLYRGPAFVDGYKEGRSLGRDRRASLKVALWRALGLGVPA